MYPAMVPPAIAPQFAMMVALDARLVISREGEDWYIRRAQSFGDLQVSGIQVLRAVGEELRCEI